MHRLRRWFALLLVLALVAIAAWLWWWFALRGSPHTLKTEQASLAYELGRTGWVSPHVNGKIVYVVVHGDCPACAKLETGVLQTLRARGVDTRIIVIAPADLNGKSMSTATERAAVAQLWLDREWAFYKRWREPSPSTLAGLNPADGDAARTAVVGTARRSQATIADLLKRNGVKFGYPLAVWWNKAGDMRASVVDNDTAERKAEREIEAG